MSLCFLFLKFVESSFQITLSMKLLIRIQVAKGRTPPSEKDLKNPSWKIAVDSGRWRILFLYILRIHQLEQLPEVCQGTLLGPDQTATVHRS